MLRETSIGKMHRRATERERESDRRTLSPAKFAQKWNPFDDDIDAVFTPTPRAKRRESSALNQPTGDTLAQLHALIDRYGVAGVLTAIRQHADDLSQVEDFDASPDEAIDVDAWSRFADSLESLIQETPT